MQQLALAYVTAWILSETIAEPQKWERALRESGAEYAHNLANGQPQHGQIFYQERWNRKWGDEADALQVHLGYRFIINADSQLKQSSFGLKRNVEKMIAFGEKPWGNWKLNLGLQEVSWGENLLLPILDVVNPRNVGYLRGFYDVGAKQPSPMALLEWREGIYDAQLIAVPWAIKSGQPDKIGDYGVEDSRHYSLGYDSEYGARAGLFSEGLDTHFYYFRHHPREPNYRFLPYSGEKDITPYEEMVSTSGMSFSYGEDVWLLRGDLAHHTNFSVTTIGAKGQTSDLSQSILGLSVTSESGTQSLGLELHNDFWSTLPEAYSKGPWAETKLEQELLTWLAVTANLSFLQSRFDPQIFYLRGLDNQDELWRFVVLSRSSDNVNLAMELQHTEAATTSPKILLNNLATLAFRCTVAW